MRWLASSEGVGAGLGSDLGHRPGGPVWGDPSSAHRHVSAPGQRRFEARPCSGPVLRTFPSAMPYIGVLEGLGCWAWGCWPRWRYSWLTILMESLVREISSDSQADAPVSCQVSTTTGLPCMPTTQKSTTTSLGMSV